MVFELDFEGWFGVYKEYRGMVNLDRGIEYVKIWSINIDIYFSFNINFNWYG